MVMIISQATRRSLSRGSAPTRCAYSTSCRATFFANPMRYITGWVANHVNDISKTDPHVALDTLERWRSLGHQRPRDMGYVIGHAAGRPNDH